MNVRNSSDEFGKRSRSRSTIVDIFFGNEGTPLRSIGRHDSEVDWFTPMLLDIHMCKLSIH